VQVPPSIPQETLEILAGLKGRYEKHHNVRFSKDTLKFMVKQADRFIHTNVFPDKAVAVVWSHSASDSTKFEILGRASIDNGKHFSPAVSFSNKEDNSIHPDVAISGTRVFVVWESPSANQSIVKSTSVEIEIASPGAK
jgi:hypothetical protein